MEKIIVFSAPDKQNEAAKETAMQYARLSKEEADRSGGQAGRAGEEAERAKGYADRIDLGALDAAVLSTGTDAETALLAKLAAEQAATDAANDANAQIIPNVTEALNAKDAAQLAEQQSAASAAAALAAAGVAAGSATNNDKLIAWVKARAWVFTAVTYDADGVPMVGAEILWPDGGVGTLYSLTKSTAFPSLINAFSLTHIGFGRRVSQPTITRDDFGRIILQPALTTNSYTP